MIISDRRLYLECFLKSANQRTIFHSHLPFEDGYYITQYGFILMVISPNIYQLDTEGWVPAQHRFDLWYDSTTDFSDIPASVAERLKLSEYKIVQPQK